MYVVVWLDKQGEPQIEYFSKKTKAKRYIKEELMTEANSFIKAYRLDLERNELIETKL